MSKNSLQNKLTKEILEYEYKICGSMRKIADKLNISIDSIYKYMKLYEIPYEKHYQKIYSCDENIFSYDTPESFYLAGFIAADGSVQNRKYSKILKIALSKKDKDHLEKIKTLLKSNHPIKDYKVKPSKLVKKSHYCSEIQITSHSLVNDLQRFNIVQNKTLTYIMPKWLIKHPLVNHFMRGYFDGDGTISWCGLGKGRTVKQLIFSILGTKTFIHQYRNLLINNCFLNKAKITTCKNVYKISYSGNIINKKLYYFLYENASIYLDRKYKRFQVVME